MSGKNQFLIPRGSVQGGRSYYLSPQAPSWEASGDPVDTWIITPSPGHPSPGFSLSQGHTRKNEMGVGSVGEDTLKVLSCIFP